MSSSLTIIYNFMKKMCLQCEVLIHDGSTGSYMNEDNSFHICADLKYAFQKKASEESQSGLPDVQAAQS